ncbi:MAG TPA: hypothetical protein VFK79_07480 [Xanthobacteraceae bacterium]|nr:hypothetical protein [Xanthobacteraceae bacterium]
MKKSLSHGLAAVALAAATWLATSPAIANPAVACRVYQPGLLAFMTGTRPAPCAYQGDYIVKHGPTYDGPAVVAPQSTYSPSPRVAAYVHGAYRAEPVVQVESGRLVRRTAVKRVDRTVVKRPVVNLKNELPARKGKAQIVHARAEVRIYGSDRMDIRLYRR